jgi:hypothetical protein
MGEAFLAGPAGRIVALPRALGSGLALGGAAVDARSSRVVHGHVGVDGFVTQPATPAVTVADFIESHQTAAVLVVITHGPYWGSQQRRGDSVTSR